MLCAFDVESPPLHAYGPLCTLFYDADKPVAADAEVGWYAEHLPKGAGPLLELMCGSGRLLVPLVEAGFKLHGVDFSAAMLASAKRGSPRANSLRRCFARTSRNSICRFAIRRHSSPRVRSS
jgi:tRNA/tmRNA/rRNA uracil-C5-methylase (TrmA/RlmC/RlmD family)